MNKEIESKEPIKPSGISTNEEISQLSDKDLFELCKNHGKNARKWSREFGFLLPEVARRNLHRKKGFESIHQFAAIIGGMSHDVVDRILLLSHQLSEMPKLWNLLRKHGWSKLRVVSTIATRKTEDFWVEKVKILTRPTLMVFVKELKRQDMLPGQVKSSALFDNLGTLEPTENTNMRLDKAEIGGALDLCSENSEKSISARKQKGNPNDCNCDTRKQIRFRKLKFRVDHETEGGFRVFKGELEKTRKEAVTMGEALNALIQIAQISKELSCCLPKQHRSLFPFWRH
ncbi:MAG: hypothetical protein O3B47_05265 [bacterium]|nr:hypothetical protein [bacterium]